MQQAPILSRMSSIDTILSYFFKMLRTSNYEGWNFNSGNYLFTTDTK